ncbi:MAG TPA: hypothetical protein VME70_13130 [Mycobacteriales bacterium]|nr:hypothetical protein [Mycobacteriales bacterium]
MAETPQEFYDRVVAASTDGRLPVPSSVTDSEIFPFETEGLRVRPLSPPVLPEPPRAGEEGGAPCARCALGEEQALWGDERWLLVPPGEPVGLPFAALLMPREHLDFGELDGGLAAELGRLLVAIERAVKTLDGVARVHVNIWGDGGEHLHVWFLARPLGLLQLRGSCLPDWLDLLPARPAEDVAADQRAVVDALVVSYGGHSLIDQ